MEDLMFSHNGPNADTVFESMTTTPPQPFYGSFPGPPVSAGARRELLDFTVQGEINRQTIRLGATPILQVHREILFL